MTGDEEKSPPEASKNREQPLPPSVVRALEKARDAVRADRERKAGRWLALIPVGIGVIFLALLMPRATEPDAVPLPLANGSTLRAIARADDARAAAADATRLPTDVLAVGSAIRAIHAAQEREGDETQKVILQRELERAVSGLVGRDSLEGELLALRAIQTRAFLDALAVWEATGEKSKEHAEVAGDFVERAEHAGWVGPGRRLILDEHQRRVAFKTVWNALARLDGRPSFKLALDEERALYALYIGHPHPPESQRNVLAVERRQATTPEACRRVEADTRRLTETWRAEKIRRFGTIDPAYPTSYALGVVYYRAGRFDLAAEELTRFVGEHRDGPYALRAKNHLKAALREHGTP